LTPRLKIKYSEKNGVFQARHSRMPVRSCKYQLTVVPFRR